MLRFLRKSTKPILFPSAVIRDDSPINTYINVFIYVFIGVSIYAVVVCLYVDI